MKSNGLICEKDGFINLNMTIEVYGGGGEVELGPFIP